MTRLQKLAQAIERTSDRKQLARMNLLWWREWFREELILRRKLQVAGCSIISSELAGSLANQKPVDETTVKSLLTDAHELLKVSHRQLKVELHAQRNELMRRNDGRAIQ